MAEPTNRELLTHIEYIRERVDEVRSDVKGVVLKTDDHEIRLVRLESAKPLKNGGRWGAVGGFIGGILSGFVGGKLTH